MRLNEYKVLFNIFFVLLYVLNSNPILSQNYDDLPDVEPGKCYAKCLTSEAHDTIVLIHYSLSDDFQGKEINYISKTFSIDTQNQVWIKAYKNNSQEELWEINNQNLESKTIKLLNRKNRKKLDPMNIDTIQIEICQIIQKFTNWQEVVCERNLTKELIEKVIMALYDRGYELDLENNENMPKDSISLMQMKNLLKKFQRDNKLSIGALTRETLNELEIDF